MRSSPFDETGQRAGGARQHSKAGWAAQKAHIVRYYINENMTLPDVMKIMSSEHDFHAT